MQTIKIRNANENDIAVINQLATKIWHDHYPGIITVEQINFMLDKMYSHKVIEEQMQNGYIWLLASDNKTPLGFLSCNKVNEGNYFLNKLYIDTTNQQKGIGGLLLKTCIGMCDGINAMRLQVNRKNVKAINFYFKNGFVIEDAKDFDIGSGYFMKDFVMIKKFN